MQKIYFADFETTQAKAPDYKVRVYLWVILSSENEYLKYGKKLETFMSTVSGFKNAIIFFHNLTFDFSYIHSYLIKNDIPYTILEKNGVIYSVKFFNVELRDSMNFLNMPLREVGENYCSINKKGSIDYQVDYNHNPTKIEIEYCIKDCLVLEEGLSNYLNNLHQILLDAGAIKSATKVWKKLTNAGISFEAFKELSDYNLVCPKTTQTEYELYKKAYRGGYVYSRPMGLVSDIQMIDCNSMYPYMYATIDMPFGSGYECKEEKNLYLYKFFIVAIKIKYELKKGYIPIIGGGIGKFGAIVYKSTSNGEYEYLVLAKYDFELIKKFYDIDYSYVWGVGFDTKPEFFKKYADTFIAVKNKEQGVKRAVAKILLNSPYGKTAENGFEEIYDYVLDENEVVTRSVIGYKLDEDRYQYLPIAIAITSSARYYLLTTAESIGFDNICYMDTDSIKYFYKKVPFDFDPNTLGAWKNEGRVPLFKTLAPKKYGYWDGKKIHFKCAGFSQRVMDEVLKNGQEVNLVEAKRLLNMFEKGLQLSCLQSKLVDGGRALLPVLKEIK